MGVCEDATMSTDGADAQARARAEARRLRNVVYAEWLRGYPWAQAEGVSRALDGMETLIGNTLVALAEGERADEREACAKVADSDTTCPWPECHEIDCLSRRHTASNIAHIIRARGSRSPEPETEPGNAKARPPAALVVPGPGLDESSTRGAGPSKVTDYTTGCVGRVHTRECVEGMYAEPAQPEPPHFHGLTACWGKVGASGGSPTICPEAPPPSQPEPPHCMDPDCHGESQCGKTEPDPDLLRALRASLDMRGPDKALQSREENKCLRHGIYCQGGSGQVVNPVAACRAWDPPKFAADPEKRGGE